MVCRDASVSASVWEVGNGWMELEGGVLVG